jgi:hypothetical protein
MQKHVPETRAGGRRRPAGLVILMRRERRRSCRVRAEAERKNACEWRPGVRAAGALLPEAPLRRDNPQV